MNILKRSPRKAEHHRKKLPFWPGRVHMNDLAMNIPETISKAIHHELEFIEEMNYAAYFLTVYDIVRFARSQGILCQGRGSAANSTICYCLGITSVDPTKFDLLFERFISSARNEPPDIDVDFEHERREEVIQYIYQKYGRDRAAIVALLPRNGREDPSGMWARPWDFRWIRSTGFRVRSGNSRTNGSKENAFPNRD